MRWSAVQSVVLSAMLAAIGTYLAVKHVKSKTEDPLKAEFEHFIAKWGKSYTQDERESRFAIFKDNYAFVNAENAKGHKYKLAVNEFSDLTADEFGASHMGLKLPEKMWGEIPYLGQHKYSGASLPASIDWTQKGAVTPVKNQGHCGSCWSFSVTGSLEGAWEIATGKLVSLSEQQFVDCSLSFGNNGCNGGVLDNGFKFAEKHALCTEESYPYKAALKNCTASSCTIGIPKGGVIGFKDVDKEDLRALEEAVAQQPVSVQIQAHQKVFQHYHSGVFTATCGSKIDHGVLAVGYGTLDGTDYWKIKNSWGPKWGEQGYILLEKGKNSAGECGIKLGPSYPVVSSKHNPSLGSSPPSPPTPPSPPSPSTSHYEKPPCQSDETEASVQGANGEVCAPKCDGSGNCPTDVPVGTKDKPKCVLQDQSGNKYCALTCLVGGCPTGAKCAHVGGITGICVYPTGDRVSDMTLHPLKWEESTVSI